MARDLLRTRRKRHCNPYRNRERRAKKVQATVCGNIKDTSLYPAVDATAHLMDKVERVYFRERFVKHGDRNELKRSFLKQYGITARQLNGVIFNRYR